MQLPLVVCLVGLAFSSCENRKPALSDADYEAFKAANPSMKNQCLNAIRYEGLSAWRPDDTGCFEMTSVRRWTGLWQTGWEWSNFCPEPAKTCNWMESRGTWLTFANDREPKAHRDGIYQIDFIGRRTVAPGNFGHLGSYDHLMIVDQIRSIKWMSDGSSAKASERAQATHH
jgi:hypothetical protein